MILHKYINKMFRLISYPSFPDGIRVVTPKETLESIIGKIERKIPGGYLRFGDGDVNLLYGKNDMLQNTNPMLQSEMKETFQLAGDGIMKALPIHSIKYGISEGMKPGIHESSNAQADELLRSVYMYFIGHEIYSPVALAYLAATDKEYTVNYLKILRRNPIIFIGNKNVSNDVISKLFNTNIHIQTPDKQAFDAIDRIEREFENLHLGKDTYHIVVLAMGCSGRILAKRLINKYSNVFTFDFGSLLDAFCGWQSRAWIELVDKEDDYWLGLLNDVAKAK